MRVPKEGTKSAARKLSVHSVGIQVENHRVEGEAVVFIHHGGSNLRMWDPVAPTSKRTIAPSPSICAVMVVLMRLQRAIISMTWRGIDGVLDVSGIERAHVIGSSLGAEVGLGLAANYPERVRSLVAEDAMHPFGWVLNPEPMARAALRFLGPRD